MDAITAINQHPWLLEALVLVIGLCIGSFLNVLIYRLPVMMETAFRSECELYLEQEPVQENAAEEPEVKFNIAFPNSHCPRCKHEIRAWENIPVLSWLLLRGRCSNCDSAISMRYPAVELACGLLSLILAMQFGSASLGLLGALVLTWALIALTMIDIDHQLLPDNITLPLLWLGLLFNISGTYASLPDAVIGAMAGYLSLWSVYWLFKLLTGKDGMGYGDFKLLAALGAWLGWQALPMIILLSSLVGAILGGLMMVLQRRGKDIPMPFGPYLAIAGWIAFMWGADIMAWYWAFAGLQSNP